ncbi:MAG TPA: hypothetical protein VGN72_11575 [Tepidisphaeraceae bacterium]|jgi:hypothetical protein|nr:hypothetical protein [Tepidisphaeraceae bacterium]
MLDTQSISADSALEMIVEAMESMTFVSPFPADGVPTFSAGEQPLMRCTIGFGGSDAEGGVTMVLPLALAKVFAANLLGCDPDAPDAAERATDCAAEMMNVMCGRLLASLPPASLAGIEMRLPQCTDVPADAPDADVAPPPGAYVLDGDGHLFWIAVAGLGW